MKLFKSVIFNVRKKLECFPLASISSPSLKFESRGGAYAVLHYSLSSKGLPGPNTLAYYKYKIFCLKVLKHWIRTTFSKMTLSRTQTLTSSVSFSKWSFL
jgi:hypothetical protein